MVAQAGSRLGWRPHQDEALADEGVQLPQQPEGDGPLTLQDQHLVAHAVRKGETATLDARLPQEDLGVDDVVVIPLGRRGLELVTVDLRVDARVLAREVRQVGHEEPLLEEARQRAR